MHDKVIFLKKSSKSSLANKSERGRKQVRKTYEEAIGEIWASSIPKPAGETWTRKTEKQK